MKRHKQIQYEFGIKDEPFALNTETAIDPDRIAAEASKREADEMEAREREALDQMEIPAADTSVLSCALSALTKYADEMLSKEGITKDILDYIDLDVAFSPVICIRGESIHDAVDVTESSDPDKFLLTHWCCPSGWASRESLKIMRARYLLARQGPPNPEPILSIDTTTPEGQGQARKLLAALRGEL